MEWNRGNPERATELYEETLKLDPMSSALYFNAGLAD